MLGPSGTQIHEIMRDDEWVHSPKLFYENRSVGWAELFIVSEVRLEKLGLWQEAHTNLDRAALYEAHFLFFRLPFGILQGLLVASTISVHNLSVHQLHELLGSR